MSSFLNDPTVVSASALMLLYPSSGGFHGLRIDTQRAHKGPYFAGEESFEAADDLGFGLAFGGAASYVGLGRFVMLHSHDDGAVERSVGLAVTATVEPVAGRHP